MAYVSKISELHGKVEAKVHEISILDEKIGKGEQVVLDNKRDAEVILARVAPAQELVVKAKVGVESYKAESLKLSQERNEAITKNKDQNEKLEKSNKILSYSPKCSYD